MDLVHLIEPFAHRVAEAAQAGILLEQASAAARRGVLGQSGRAAATA
jgi:hypothetical protein